MLSDLLTEAEAAAEARTGHLRFNIELAQRLLAAIDWLAADEPTRGLPLGLFGASTGAAAALVAAVRRPDRVAAVVSRGGRPDLAGPYPGRVRAPTLLIVGSKDTVVVELNRKAQTARAVETALEVVPGATHLFPEPGALEHVLDAARGWFLEWLPDEPAATAARRRRRAAAADRGAGRAP